MTVKDTESFAQNIPEEGPYHLETFSVSPEVAGSEVAMPSNCIHLTSYWLCHWF